MDFLIDVKRMTRKLPVENHHISFDSQIHTKMNYDDWLNVNRQFLLLVLQIVHRLMPPKFHLYRNDKYRKFNELSLQYGAMRTISSSKKKSIRFSVSFVLAQHKTNKQTNKRNSK